MKNSKHQLRVAFVWSLFAFVMISMAMLTTACGKKDGKKTAGTPGRVIYDPNCPNCNVDGTLLGAALGFNGGTAAGYKMQLGLTLTGSGGSGSSLGYSGPVAGAGVMFVNSSSQYCPMVIGAYTVATVTTGNWDSSADIIRNLVLEARHGDGTLIRMRVLYGIIDDVQPNLRDAEGFTYPYGLTADIVVDSVNNVPCVAGYPGLPALNQFFFSY